VNQNVLIPDEDGMVPYNETVRSKLYAMGYTYNPARAKVKLRGFTGWKNPQLCYAQTTQAIKHRHKMDDVIVMLGSNHLQRPMHVILVDAHNKIVFDNNKDSAYEGTYHPGDGYFSLENGKRLYDDMHRVTVKEFLKATQQGYEGSGMKKLVSIKSNPVVAKVDEQVLQDVIKSLYLMLYYVNTDNAKIKIPATLKANALKWGVNLKKFLAQFKIPNDDFVALLNASRNVSKYDAKVAALAPVVGNMLLKAKDKFTADNTIPAHELMQLLTVGKYFRTNSEVAGKKLLKNAGNLKDPELLALFSKSDAGGKVTDTGSGQAKARETMQTLSQKYLKKKLIQLTAEQKAVFKKKAPDAFKEFKRAQRDFLAAPSNFLRAAVRKSGKSYIDYNKFLDSIAKAKISHGYPKGFVGNIDENGRFYTAAGNVLQEKLWGEVKMNPKYNSAEDNAYVCLSAKPTDKKPGRRYTENYVLNKRQGDKYETMERTKENLGPIRKKWIADLMHGTGRDQLRAAELEMIYLLGARPGTKGNKATEKTTGEVIDTYGVTTLLVKHVKPHGKGYMLDYKGKGTTAMDFQLNPINQTNKKVIEVLEKQIEGKGPTEQVWIDGNGKTIPTQDVLNYAKRVAGDPNVKLYTFRYMAANKIAAEILSKQPFKKGKVSQKEAEKWFNEKMEKVGDFLKHHTGNKVTSATAIRSYISPRVMHKFFLDLGLRVPANIPNISAKDKAAIKGKKV